MPNDTPRVRRSISKSIGIRNRATVATAHDKIRKANGSSGIYNRGFGEVDYNFR